MTEMIYNKAMLADHSAALLSFSQELDHIAQEAHNLLAGSQEFFQSPQGAAAYAEAQQAITDGINEGREVIARHGDAIDTSATNYEGTDGAAAASFTGI